MADVLRVHAATMAVVQDTGRPGYARLGVPPNGAHDQHAMAMANALTGSPLGDPVVENTLLDFACSFSVETVVAVTGAPAKVHIDGVEMPQWAPLRVQPDAVVEIGRVRDGLHVYLAAAGTLTAPAMLGSCAPDPLASFGTKLQPGDELPFRGSGRRLRATPTAIQVPEYGSPWRIDVCSGPEGDWYGTENENSLRGEYVVSKESNHVGMRLTGETPAPITGYELVSRAVPTGAVEIPAEGQLIVLRRGRGVTAGYPVAAVVSTVGQSLIAQARPGHEVRFLQVTEAEARSARRAQFASVEAVLADADRFLTGP